MKKLLLLFAAALLATAINAQQGNGGSVINSNRTVIYSADASKLTKGKVTFAQGSSDKITMPVYKRVATTPLNFGPEASIGSFTVYFDADRCQMVLQNNCNQPIMVKVLWTDGTAQGYSRVRAGANQTGYNDLWKGFRGKSIYLKNARMRKCAGIGHDN